MLKIKKIHFNLNAMEDLCLVFQVCASFGIVNCFEEFQGSTVDGGPIEFLAATSGALVKT